MERDVKKDSSKQFRNSSCSPARVVRMPCVMPACMHTQGRFIHGGQCRLQYARQPSQNESCLSRHASGPPPPPVKFFRVRQPMECKPIDAVSIRCAVILGILPRTRQSRVSLHPQKSFLCAAQASAFYNRLVATPRRCDDSSGTRQVQNPSNEPEGCRF